mgnify:CR=1 FL=1
MATSTTTSRRKAARGKAVSPAPMRVETDTFGPIDVPADRYWGAQTQRSRQNFRIGTERMPEPVVRALAIVKLAAAETNLKLGLLDKRRAQAIARAAALPQNSAVRLWLLPNSLWRRLRAWAE